MCGGPDSPHSWHYLVNTYSGWRDASRCQNTNQPLSERMMDDHLDDMDVRLLPIAAGRASCRVPGVVIALVETITEQAGWSLHRLPFIS